MTDPPSRDSPDDIGPRSRQQTVGAPRWAKAFGIIGLVLVVLLVVLLLVGGGNHGPGRHSSSGDPDREAAPVGNMVQPGGVDHVGQQGRHGADEQ